MSAECCRALLSEVWCVCVHSLCRVVARITMLGSSGSSLEYVNGAFVGKTTRLPASLSSTSLQRSLNILIAFVFFICPFTASWRSTSSSGNDRFICLA